MPDCYRTAFHKVKNAALWAKQYSAAITVSNGIELVEFPVSTGYFSLMAKAYVAQQKSESKKK